MARLRSTDLTQVQEAVVQDVRRRGAVTARRVERDHGPIAAWESLIESHWLTSHDSVHGTLVTLGTLGRAHFTDQKVYVPYLSGPSAVLDRAYQNDALECMQAEGYTVVDCVHKRATGITQKTSGRKVTAQILYHILRAPNFSDSQRYHRTPPDSRDRVKGHPFLYATVSGGSPEQRLRQLVRRYTNNIQSWDSPLLLAVPDLAAVWRVEREINLRQQRGVEEHERRFPYQSGRLVRTLVRVIHVPHPEPVTGRYGQ
ncbi:hypothetical protein [uncultured Deinococcus sp.]|uniref:hypothetical protein n=1 Tax=uncultured Deinococcus sp. TaxID=158789 RepID=UPI0025EC1253|nr:hypothetical protein [uncultured Deinococcus sp.]